MTNVKLLSEVVRGRLAVVAEEICGIVERTIVEEISQYKQEVDRQQKLLDAILSPRVEPVRRDGTLALPHIQSEDHNYEQNRSTRSPEGPIICAVAGVKKEEEDLQTSEEKPSCQVFVPNDFGQNQTPSSHESHEYECPPSNISTCGEIVTPASAVTREVDETEKDPSPEKSDQELGTSLRSEVTKGVRKREIYPTRTVLLRISVVIDPDMQVLSNHPCPTKKLRVPFGLQEAEFIELLRFNFPELGNKPFDALKVNSRRSLCPLNLTSFTPRQIIKSACLGRSALYIRLKEYPEEHSTSPSRLQPQQPEDVSSLGFCDNEHSRSPTLNDPGSKVTKGMTKRETYPPRTVLLRISVIIYPDMHVLVNQLCKKCPSKKLRVPFGLQEAEFIEFLRFNFPVLGDKPFDALKVNSRRSLCPLNLTSFTPRQIIKSACLGRSALYIRLKENPEEDTTSEPSRSPTLNDPGCQSPVHGCLGGCLFTLRVCVLTNPGIDVVTADVSNRYRVQKLRVRRCLQEAEFLNLLVSIFPRLSDKSFDVLKADKNRKLHPVKIDRLLPKEIVSSSCLGRSALYIRLKEGDDNQTIDSAGPSTSKEDGEKGGRMSSALGSVSDSDGHVNEGGDGDSDWTPSEGTWSDSDEHKAHARTGKRSKVLRKKTTWKSTLQTKSVTGSNSVAFSCKVCEVTFLLACSLVKHALVHADDAERVCGFCGKHLGPDENLADHLKAHAMEKSYKCDKCHKLFTTRAGMLDHLTLHTGEKPYCCTKCGKNVRSYISFMRHKKSHTKEKNHECKQCGKRFGHAAMLKIHMNRHEKPTNYVCDICGQMLCRNTRLISHMRIHNGEKPYRCRECGKGFRDNGSLVRHVKTHSEKHHSCS